MNSHPKKEFLCLIIQSLNLVVNSFLSAEDKNFFKHPGVDAKGVLRAVVNNISNIISL